MPTEKKGQKILVIPDAQVKKGVDTSHILAAGKMLVDEMPDVVIILGDWWDMPSLSVYDKGTLAAEGRRVKEDIQAGKEAMDLFFKPLKKLQQEQRAQKKKAYNPRKIFITGNHDERLDRIPKATPELEGVFGMELLELDSWGFEVYDYLVPAEVGGITFIHYTPNPFTGKPYGGTAMNILKNVGKSFVQGHKQSLDVAIRPVYGNQMQLGIVCGAFYSHWEEYKGLNNNHWRGLLLLNNVKDGFGDPTLLSIETLKEKYK
jgi:hypothetical protein